MIRCTLCGATSALVAVASALQAEGWTLISVSGPKANRYLSACPTHPPTEVASWVKSAIVSAKGKA